MGPPERRTQPPQIEKLPVACQPAIGYAASRAVAFALGIFGARHYFGDDAMALGCAGSWWPAAASQHATAASWMRLSEGAG